MKWREHTLKDEENLRRDRLLGNLIDEMRTLTQTRVKFPGLYIMLISGRHNDRSVQIHDTLK